MKFSRAAVLALFCTVLAASPNELYTNPLVQGAQGSITNSRQVFDTLNHELKSHDGHATADVLVAFITGADSQIDNAIATVTNALAPFTLGASKLVGNFLLGPVVQSITNGAEVMLANLVAMPFDGISDAVANSVKNYQKSLSRMSTMAAKNDVSTAHLNAHITKMNEVLSKHAAAHKHKRANHNNQLDGIEGSVTNSRQVFDTLNRELKSHDGHPTADVLVAFITGADSQIDNTIATVTNALAPLTFGLSKAVGNFLLGPVVQSITNGAEVMLANLVAMPFDGISDVVMNGVKNYQKSLTKVSAVAAKHDVKTTHLDAHITKLNEIVSQHKGHHKRANHNNQLDGIEGSVTNSRQVFDTLNRELKSHDGHPTADVLVAFITGADSQIDNTIATVTNALAPLTFGLSKAVGNFLLGPVVQSITNGAEVMLANLVAMPFDGISDVVMNGVKNYQKNVSRMSSLSIKHDVHNSQSLAGINNKLEKFISDAEAHKAAHSH